MLTIPFQKPEKVLMLESSDSFGVFEFRPLQQGYGQTIGNALRRVLLSAIEGYAITSIKIEGVPHEFSTIPGVMEDVTDIILKIKQIRLKSKIEDHAEERIRFTISGKNEFKAGDMNNFLNGFQVLNTDLLICTMEPNVKLTMELTINKGRGYISAEENKLVHDKIGTIPVDSIHTPIKNVMYRVENYRVEQKTDFEKLVLEITTDSSVSPKEALRKAAIVLIQHFLLFTDDKMALNIEEMTVADDFDEDSINIRQLLKSRLVEMNLSVRALNCLKAADVETVAELISFQKSELLKFRNFGKKSLVELENFIKARGLDFGMNISKYKLDLEKE